MELDIKLITLVERFPQLYSKRDPLYKDKIANENAWTFISRDLKIPAETCVSRWGALRNRYSKERAKIIPSGASASTSKEWPLLKYLVFLNDVVRKRKTFGGSQGESLSQINNVEEEEEGSQQEGTEYESVDDITEMEGNNSAPSVTPTSSVVTSRSVTPHRTLKSDNGVAPLLHEAVDVLKTFTSERNSVSSEEMSIQGFCNSLYNDLKLMERDKLRKCKIAILRIIDDYSS